MNALTSYYPTALDNEQAILLPERETMAALLDFVVINAINVAIAVNLGSLGSTAAAAAVQAITVNQS